MAEAASDTATSAGLAAQAGPVVIAVDGPSGSGKSTAARGVATALGLRYLDTGATYRALTWWMLEHGVDLHDAGAVVAHARDVRIEVGTDPRAQFTLVDGVDVTAPIRERRVSNAVSLVAAIPGVRQLLIPMQQRLIAQAEAEAGGIVAEGRDIGTVVAPGAAVKVFLTASEQARAERRTAELAAEASTALAKSAPPQSAKSAPPQSAPAQRIDAGLTLREQANRDRLDAAQSQRAADAVEVDATELDVPEVITLIIGLAKARRVIHDQ
jgi:cytidylate kinase